eukprot:TRINITY_DN65522_c0_g1_i1.p1 TRINITY_DN65522_c0_g1~~TRINITY_DN65522_c0_g1_i1.p1  ORF type:complete len:449 (+),score=27.93 TRINITY_DN65522_c0_g1_i1:77-1423(+)
MLESSEDSASDQDGANNDSFIRRCFRPCCEDAPYKSRDSFWDNYKGLGQLMVVTVHLGALGFFLAGPKVTDWLDSIPGRFMMILTTYFCSFMMPSFCFITGFLSTSSPNARQLNNQVRYATTFFIQHALIVVLGTADYTSGEQKLWNLEHPDVNATNVELVAAHKDAIHKPGYVPLPYYQTLSPDWYLWCVVLWRCLLPSMSRLSTPLTVSLVLALSAIWTDAFISTYSLTPFTFLPFFICGYLAKDKEAELNSWRNGAAAKALLLCSTAIVFVSQSYLWPRTVLMDGMDCVYGGQIGYSAGHGANYYYEMKNTSTMANSSSDFFTTNTFCQSAAGLGCTTLFYVMAFCLVFSFMAVVPAKDIQVLTKCGRNSIYIYLTQMWFALMPVLIIGGSLALKGISVGPWLAFVITVLVVFFFWWALAQPCVKCICGPCVEPNVERCGLVVDP